ncbi:MAG: Response regulator PleD [Pelotomaculum sp. PtaU1.Bin065]|nr:MAG: Response regulator PleD [Pelotomaculum sp. PtaU1.Bin065]
MKILIASNNDAVAEYLVATGHKTRTIYANNLAAQVFREFGCEAVIYINNVRETLPHTKVLKFLSETSARVVLVADLNDPLVSYAESINIADILVPPVRPDDILRLLESSDGAPEIGGKPENIRQRLAPVDKMAKITFSSDREKVIEKTNNPANLSVRFGGVVPETGFASLDEIPGVEFYSSVRELCETDPVAVLISAGRTDLIETIKKLRREYRLLPAPVVVVGNCDTAACYAAGANECVDILDGPAIGRIKASSVQMREMWSKAVKDDLTGLYKREFLVNYLKEQERKWKETGSPFSVLMCDLDYFKQVNDTYGHPAGDAVLKDFAQFLTSKVRETDIVSRYGGEEFLVVFPGLEDTRAIAEKLCNQWAIKEIIISRDKKINSTFSAGLAVMGRDAKDAEIIISVADKALYHAKKMGRNRIVSADEKMDLAIESPLETQVVMVKPVPQQSNANQWKERGGISQQAALANGCTVIAICSPCASGGSSSFASLMTRKLAENAKGKITAVDCDLEGRGLGLRMGMKLIDLENRDWRKMGAPIDISGICVYPLDPSSEEHAEENHMTETIQKASLGTDKLVIDLGSNMRSWWFRCGYSVADVIMWVIRSDPLLLEKAKSNWINRPRAGCREFLILFGKGSPEEMEEIFMLPCYQVSEKRGFKRVKALLQSKLTKGRRVLMVGFKKVPDINGFVCDAFNTAEEAIEWIKYNVPNKAFLANDLKKISIIEYDLNKLGVPVRRVSHNELAIEFFKN